MIPCSMSTNTVEYGETRHYLQPKGNTRFIFETISLYDFMFDSFFVTITFVFARLGIILYTFVSKIP